MNKKKCEKCNRIGEWKNFKAKYVKCECPKCEKVLKVERGRVEESDD